MLEKIKSVKSLDELQALHSETFGKNGTMTARLKEMKNLPEAERAALNAEKEKLQTAFKERQEQIENETMLAALEGQRLDATESGASSEEPVVGRIHPLTQSYQEICGIWRAMGYDVAFGPEIESDWYNFAALNVPETHPARDMQDTFFIEGTKNLLRTQDTAVSAREMEKRKGGAFKVIAPGATYRRDLDATHAPSFRQVDWAAVDESGKLTLSDLISDIKTFLVNFFGTDDIAIRLRPSYFPFTEPSLELDMQWDRATGKPAKSGGDWLELGGMGMLHPNVLENCGIDPSKFQGFAGAIGWERVAMLKYGINDIRKFYEGDIRWLKTFGF